MKQLKYPLLILTFCLTGLASHAGEQYMLERLSNENGLSNNSVNCFCEDSRHRLWVGTWDGLNVYDGRTFRIYRHKRNSPGSIGNNIIRQIIEQDSLTIWVVTNDCVFTRKRLDVLPSLLCCAPLLERSLSSNSFHVEILGDVVNRLDWV